MVRRSIAIVLIVLIIICISVLGLMLAEQYRIRGVINNYLNALKQKDYNEAFENVAYFDKSSDILPILDYESAKKIWTERVTRLESTGIYLKDYHSVKVWKDDGYPRGKAKILLREGNQEKLYEVSIHLAKLDGQWKVQSIYSSAELNKFEEAIRGYVGLESK